MMTNETSDHMPILYWSDYFDEEDTGQSEWHEGKVSMRMLALAIALSSALWALILVGSHLLF